MFFLSNLLNYQKLVIQCHDNPDADSIASAFALYKFFKHHNKEVEIIYGGLLTISKPNLKQFVKLLNIPIKHIHSLSYKPDLLITVDCQYGESNVTKFGANNIAIIDHHLSSLDTTPLREVVPYLASCSTLIWDLLNKNNFDISKDIHISTALYYGLYSDSNGFSEISHPLDRDMRDSLQFDKSIILKLKNSNLSFSDLEIAGIALLRCSHNDNNRFAILKAHNCDQNILGFISDLAIQVDTIDTCIVYNETDIGYRFSLRSCIKEINASELAEFICKDLGSGGGHTNKAGGFISTSAYKNKFNNLHIEAFILNNVNEYYESFNIVYSGESPLNLSEFILYKQKENILGYVPTIDLFPSGTPILIRAMQGDLEIISNDDIFILVGSTGEITPITKSRFFNTYKTLFKTFKILSEYTPQVKNKNSGEIINLISKCRQCIVKNTTSVYAKKLDKNIKLFPYWNKDKYTTGFKDDYLAVSKKDLKDMYIIKKDIFFRDYE